MIFKNPFRRKNSPAAEPRLFVVVGLGNPGAEYASTRHNLGFLALDHLAARWEAPGFRAEKRFTADIAPVHRENMSILLVKPQTFMNESGKAVRSILDFYKLSPRRLVVIHDDLDIVAQSVKTTDSSRAAGHNGVQDIIDRVGTQDFFRIRLGIGRPTETLGICMPPHDYVLGMLSTEEREHLADMFTTTEELLTTFLARHKESGP
jgi:peptidyl-tRNA hydrolase, PTH1 family